MSNYNSLKTTINANVKQNGVQAITGQILNSVLNAMVTTLGTGYQFAGVATTATDPGSPDAKVFYIANGKGTYTNFGGVEVTEDDVVVLYWDSSWHKVSTGIASQEKLSELERNGKAFMLRNSFLIRTENYYNEVEDKVNPVLYIDSNFNCSKNSTTHSLIVIEVNGLEGEKFWCKAFGDRVSSNVRLTPYAFNEFPDVGVRGLQLGLYSDLNSRAFITLSQDSKYIVLRVENQYLEDVKNSLTLVKGNDYPSEYTPYYIEQILQDFAFDENAFSQLMPRNVGVLNEGKVLFVDGNGDINYRYPQEGEIEIPDNVLSTELLKTIFLGENLISGIVGSGSGWTYNNGVYTHNGASSVLEFNFETESGKSYVVSFDTPTSAYNENQISASIGNGYLCDAYNGQIHHEIGIISKGGRLKFTAGSNFNYSVSNVELREVVLKDNAVKSITIGAENTEATTMLDNITGWWNTAVGGIDPLLRLQNGSRNIAIGNHSTAKLESGERNIGIGTFSLNCLRYGIRNVAIGADALYRTSISSKNVAIGKASCGHTHSNPDAHSYNGNVAVGDDSLAGIAKDYKDNVAVGSLACAGSIGDVDRQRNVAVGTESGYYDDSNSTSLGYRAGRYSHGHGNVHVGANTGKVYVNHNDCVIIGASANLTDGTETSSNPTTFNNSVVIGKGAVGTKSNQVVIGNSAIEEVIFGNKKILFNADGTCTWESI